MTEIPTTNEPLAPRRGRLDRALSFIERVGNALPHPGTLFALMALTVVLLSWVMAQFDLAVTHPGTGETIRYRLLRPFADGTTHVEFAPAELAARLQALGPHGPSPRITWHGVLAPHAAARRHVVPRQLELGHVDAPARPRTRTLRRPRSLPPPREPPCPDCGLPMQLVAVDALP